MRTCISAHPACDMVASYPMVVPYPQNEMACFFNTLTQACAYRAQCHSRRGWTSHMVRDSVRDWDHAGSAAAISSCQGRPRHVSEHRHRR